MASQRHKIEQQYVASNGETVDMPGWGGYQLDAMGYGGVNVTLESTAAGADLLVARSVDVN